jgi:hypothetical protein
MIRGEMIVWRNDTGAELHGNRLNDARALLVFSWGRGLDSGALLQRGIVKMVQFSFSVAHPSCIFYYFVQNSTP